MAALLIRFLLSMRSRFESRARLEAENTVLRQQVIVLSRKMRGHIRLSNMDRLLFVWLYRLFPSILDAVVVVKPETLIRWHRGVELTGTGTPTGWVAAPRSITRSEI
jgi:hypothetical protein